MRLSDSRRTGLQVKRLALLAGLAVVYFAAGTLGLRLATVHPSATPVWAPTGIALASLLLWGRSAWPAVFVGAFLVNLVTAGNAVTSIGIAIGNTCEAVVGAYFVRRFAGGRYTFDNARSVFAFTVLAGVVSTAVSAAVGVSSLTLGGFAQLSDFGAIWSTWWLGDAAGALVVAPVLLLWANRPYIRWNERRWHEAGGLILALLAIGQLVFGGLLPGPRTNLPLEFLTAPVLMWAAVRFSPREAATAVLVLSVIALRGTWAGSGPFARGTGADLLLLQSFLAIAAMTTLIVAAIVAERRRGALELKRLSESDALTGLANYRRFHDVLVREVARFGRTGKPFALLLMDLNDLKGINDEYGHVTGNRAIARVAEALRQSCRTVDTAARFGGDEFAVILPETDARDARIVAARVSERLALSKEEPSLALSFGIAQCPAEGTAPETLLDFADRELYSMKRGSGVATRQSHSQRYDTGEARPAPGARRTG